MDKNKVNKAISLQNKIDKIENFIQELEEYKDGKPTYIGIRYVKGLECRISVPIDNNDKDSNLEIKTCCDIVSSYLLEVYKKRLDRLKLEFENL